MTSEKYTPDWNTLLRLALKEPGQIADCYRYFHSYSFGNQLLAYSQALYREIEPGPIATFRKWKALERSVKKGEKAITLCRPITITIKSNAGPALQASQEKLEEPEKPEKPKEQKSFIRVRFVYENRWFFLSQTKGKPFKIESPPDWNLNRALSILNIEKIKFNLTDGNIQGFSKDRQIAINPVAGNPMKTALHEIAHIELGHTDKIKGAKISRNIGEIEAEGVAYLLGNSLGLPGAESSRAYLQHWYRKKEFPKQSAQNILTTASTILKAGQPRSKGDKDALS